MLDYKEKRIPPSQEKFTIKNVHLSDRLEVAVSIHEDGL